MLTKETIVTADLVTISNDSNSNTQMVCFVATHNKIKMNNTYTTAGT